MVLQRGWVIVGRVTEDHTDETVIENAAVIRRWGTSQGLGELASKGPQTNTRLDDCPTVRVHPLTVVMSMDVDKTNWRGR